MGGSPDAITPGEADPDGMTDWTTEVEHLLMHGRDSEAAALAVRHLSSRRVLTNGPARPPIGQEPDTGTDASVIEREAIEGPPLSRSADELVALRRRRAAQRE